MLNGSCIENIKRLPNSICSKQSNQALFEVVSDEDEDPDSDLNVIVATKIIEGKAKEAGTHTVEPLLG